MAKTKINPEFFRLGHSETWLHSVKLKHYEAQTALSQSLLPQLQNFWYNISVFNNAELHNKKKQIKNSRKNKVFKTINVLQSPNINKKLGLGQIKKTLRVRQKQPFVEQRRRIYRYISFPIFKIMSFPTQRGIWQFWKDFDKKLLSSRFCSKISFYNNIASKLYPGIARNIFTKQISKLNKNFYGLAPQHSSEKRKKKNSSSKTQLKKIILFQKKQTPADNQNKLNIKLTLNHRSLLLYQFLYWQKYVPFWLKVTTLNLNSNIQGSFYLRRYQWHLKQVQPEYLKNFLFVRRLSFLESSAYFSSHFLPHSHAYLTFLSQLNICLHWQNSSLFLQLLLPFISYWKSPLGFLRRMQRVIRNFDMNRFGISGILIHVKGSFGKMTRTKTVRIRPWREGQRESVNMLDHPVSFASTQLILLRGVLQMKVWFFSNPI